MLLNLKLPRFIPFYCFTFFLFTSSFIFSFCLELVSLRLMGTFYFVRYENYVISNIAEQKIAKSYSIVN